MKIILKSSFTAVPWKNGGGVTHEVLREPPGADLYRWRVSVAEVGSSGPFSSFVGYHRTMVLLTGVGVRLTFTDAVPRELRQAGDLVEFDGAIATDCELLAGPCTDLNLIVSQSMPRPAARIEPLCSSVSVFGMAGSTVLLFAVRGSFLLAGDDYTAALGQWDLAVLAPEDAITVSPLETGSAGTPLMFFATLDDNRQSPLEEIPPCLPN